jgi:hypothetical protein
MLELGSSGSVRGVLSNEHPTAILDPFLPFKIGPVNGRNAPRSGRSLRAREGSGMRAVNGIGLDPSHVTSARGGYRRGPT